MVSCPRDSLKIKQDVDMLVLYQWNTHTARHYFYKISRTCTFHQRPTDPSVYGISIGCFGGLDLAAFQNVSMADGVSLSLVHR